MCTKIATPLHIAAASIQCVSWISTQWHADQTLTLSHVKECMGTYPEHYDSYKKFNNDISAPPACIQHFNYLFWKKRSLNYQSMKIILESINLKMQASITNYVYSSLLMG